MIGAEQKNVCINKMSEYEKDLKDSAYNAAIISALSVGYGVIGKTFFSMTPPQITKLDATDLLKLFGIITISDLTKFILD